MHPSTDPTTMRRRDAEFAKAETKAAVDQLQERWQREDAAALNAQDYRVKEVADLQARVARLERLLGPGGKRLAGGLAKATGDALRRIRTEERERILGEVEKRGYVSYRGTWDEGADYARGAMVTCAGSTWIAVGPIDKGERPGRGASWRLAVKGESGKGPTIA
ncbi:MAG: hypothetical protein K0R41_2379 [Geminicoccaceae bacterium]|jgi:hypothetical protein|nr:hypothetical protein [Geminicoccaceae bacterium]